MAYAGAGRTTSLWWWGYSAVVVLAAAQVSGAAAIAAAVLAVLFRPFPTLAAPRLPPSRPGTHKEAATSGWQRAVRDCPKTGQQYLIIGVGFLGRRIVDRLLERGETRVRLLDLRRCEAYGGDPRVESLSGNVCTYDDVRKACEGVDCVYSTFACIQFFARLDHQAPVSEAVNIAGTANVMRACRAAGVRVVVYTSTSNAIACPEFARLGMDETSPLVPRSKSHNHYSWTKAEAERTVLAAGMENVAIIRPSSIVFGAGDVRILQRFLQPQKALCGIATAPLIEGGAKADYVFVDNVVLAHLKAEARLREGRGGVAGEVFNVSNEEPCCYEEFFRIAQQYTKGRVPFYAVPLPEIPIRVLSHLLEGFQWWTQGRVNLPQDLTMLTPATLLTQGMTYTVDCSKARERLDWAPVWDLDQAVQQTVDDILGEPARGHSVAAAAPRRGRAPPRARPRSP